MSDFPRRRRDAAPTTESEDDHADRATPDGRTDSDATAFIDRRCQIAVEYLRGTVGAVKFETLVAHMVAQEPGSASTLDGERWQEIVNALRMTYLPSLERQGVVDFDARTGEVRYRSTSSMEAVLKDVLA